MSLSLYQAFVPSCRQMLGSLSGILTRAEEHCAETGIDPTSLVQSKLIDDMFPLSFQVKQTAIHSATAIQSVRNGVFSPDRSQPPQDFAGLKAKLAEADSFLAALDPAEIDALVGQDMRFEFGDIKLPYTAEDFLLSFSQPNFYFHVSMAYAILRAQGVPLGKRDYLGQLRFKTPA